MNTLTLELELISDVVLTRQSATAGAPRSLDHLPGAVLLGACAAALYADLSEEDAWTVFHSGRVRFGVGLPVTSTGSCLPMPLAFHHLKHQAPIDPEGRLSEVVRNGSRELLVSGQPWKQLRGGFVAPDLTVVRPAHSQAQRTALKAGRARDGFLYSIDALVAGARFRADIGFDDDVPEALRRDVRQALTSHDLRLGRSRGAEFGRVRAQVRQGEPVPVSGGSSRGPLVLLLACSDLALRDPSSGAPTLEPTAAALGLPVEAFTWRPESSYLRTRRYSPFNAKRRRPDLERQVLEAGSVIAVEPGPAWSASRIAEALAGGVGDYRQDGLGQLCVDPWLLAGAHPEALVDTQPAKKTQPPPRPTDATARWLKAATDRKQASDEALGMALHWVDELGRWPALPASQWGEVRALAARAASREELLVMLFAEDTGFTKTGVGKLQQRWGARFRNETRAAALERLIKAADETIVLQAVQLVAAHVVRHRRQEVAG